MGEIKKSVESGQPTSVILEGNRLGHQITNPGDRLPLEYIFGDARGYLSGDAFSRVYFRTNSENIYLLTTIEEPYDVPVKFSSQSGVVSGSHQVPALINMKESARQRKLNISRFSDAELRQLIRSDLVVGEPFSYGRGGRTTAITEIVPVGDRIYMPDYLKEITDGNTNGIDREFKQVIQPFLDLKKGESGPSVRVNL